jgi:general secretion pathway protein L
MVSMATTSTDLRLFGLDLRKLGAELARPWRGLLDRPSLAWLSPLLPVRLIRADRSEWIQRGALWRPAGECSTQVRTAAGRATAIELPEDSVLVRELVLPLLAEADLARAVALEVAAASPFLPDDTVHGFSVLSRQGSSQRVALALTSRAAVARYLDEVMAAPAQPAEPARPAPEVWVSLSDVLSRPGPGPHITLSGFGEEGRLRRLRRGRALRLSLVLLALFWLLPAFTASTLQLSHRVRQAEAQFATLSKKAAPAVAQRTELVTQLEGLKDLNEILQERVEPLRVIALMTETLPDDTWLQSLQMQGTKITLQGLTPSAAALMQKLSTEPLFKDVKAPSAAVRQAGAAKEAFNIEFTLDTKAMRANDPEQEAPPPRPRENRPQAAADGKPPEPKPVAPVAPVAAPGVPAPAAPLVSKAYPQGVPAAVLKEAGPFGVLLGAPANVAPAAPVPPPPPPPPPAQAGAAPAPATSAPAPAPAPAKPAAGASPFSIGGGK